MEKFITLHRFEDNSIVEVETKRIKSVLQVPSNKEAGTEVWITVGEANDWEDPYEETEDEPILVTESMTEVFELMEK